MSFGKSLASGRAMRPAAAAKRCVAALMAESAVAVTVLMVQELAPAKRTAHWLQRCNFNEIRYIGRRHPRGDANNPSASRSISQTAGEGAKPGIFARNRLA